jgi:hypothetical protein
MTSLPDTIDDLRCKALYRALLKRALDDLNALLSGQSIPSGDSGRPMADPEREQLLMDTLEWFWNENDLSDCSLAVVCDNLDIDPNGLRIKTRKLAHGDLLPPHLRRRKLSPGVRQYIVDSLSRGSTTIELAAELNIDPATCRKIRIKARRAEQRGLTHHRDRAAISHGVRL